MLALMALNMKLLKHVKAAQTANLAAKDDRINAVTEVLHAMRAVKVLALEPRFIRKVEGARSREFAALCRYQYLNGFQRSTYELMCVDHTSNTGYSQPQPCAHPPAC
jgi:ABC-type bacteriocin/lantibiotic exporter with double-glycine peptidase domain